MSDAARAKPVVESCLDDGHERADHQVFVVCITCTTNAFAAEQTAALREELATTEAVLADEREELRHAVEVENALREENARLRGALERVHRQMLNHGPLLPGDSCFVCEALLADPEGQRAGQ